ncbi:Sybindin-like protein [Chytriomyces sp. MP71]|nr:Sybindin-like protein [Chytriomyces sp. MP71]
MPLHSLYIINKAGGLIYQKDYTEGIARLSSNEYLVLAGTFHSIHVITTKLSPVPGSSGIEVLESDLFKMFCIQTPTGTKFLLVTDPSQLNVEAIMRRIYEAYADYVMKNPFYTPEMPIRAELFDVNLQKIINTYNLK